MQNSYMRKKPDESIDDYLERIVSAKQTLHFTWKELADIANNQLGYDYSPDWYRKNHSSRKEYENDETELDYIIKVRKERMKASDERVQANALIRRISREETIKEIASDIAKELGGKIDITPYEPVNDSNNHNEAILELSDWHYGIDIDNSWNKYNIDIAKKRLGILLSEVLCHIKRDNIKKLHVINLGDLISGRIHLTIRLNNRIDVITQVEEVSEILAQFLSILAEYTEVHYYSTMDNHSRIEPKFKDSLELESLCRITDWYLKERLNDSIKIHDNEFADDIVTFKVFDFNVAGVHGDKDAPGKVVKNLSLTTKRHYDLICTAHLHHFSADEENETLTISNSSLMGTDDYAINLRLNSKPSQTLILCDKYCVAKAIYRIVL